MVQQFRAPAEVVSLNESHISTEIDGIVREVAADEGDEVGSAALDGEGLGQQQEVRERLVEALHALMRGREDAGLARALGGAEPNHLQGSRDAREGVLH